MQGLRSVSQSITLLYPDFTPTIFTEAGTVFFLFFFNQLGSKSVSESISQSFFFSFLFFKNQSATQSVSESASH